MIKSSGWQTSRVARRQIIEGVFGAGVAIKEAKADILVSLTPDDISKGIVNAKAGRIAVGCALSNSCARMNGRPALILRTLAYVPVIVKGKLEVHRFVLSGEARRYTMANDTHKKLVDTTVRLLAPSGSTTVAASSARRKHYNTPAYQAEKAIRWKREDIKSKPKAKSKLRSLRMATARTAAGFISKPLAA